RQIETIDNEASTLLRQQTTLVAAAEAAKEIDEQQEAEREEQDRQRHLAEANKIATAAYRLGGEIDAEMNSLTKLFERRAALLAELGRTNWLPSHLAIRFVGRAIGNGAARAAGLDRFLDVGYVSPSHKRTLGDSCSVLRNSLSLPDQTTSPSRPPQQPAPRFRLFGGQR